MSPACLSPGPPARLPEFSRARRDSVRSPAGRSVAPGSFAARPRRSRRPPAPRQPPARQVLAIPPSVLRSWLAPVAGDDRTLAFQQQGNEYAAVEAHDIAGL